MATATLELDKLPPGARFRVRQFPEGTVRGTVDLPSTAAGGDLVDVVIDGDDDGSSSWPADTVVLMTGPEAEVERLTEGCACAYSRPAR